MPFKNANTFLKVDLIPKKLPSDRRSKQRRRSDLSFRSLIEEVESELRELHDRIDQIEAMLRRIPGDDIP
jgi:hypothetical protein